MSSSAQNCPLPSPGVRFRRAIAWGNPLHVFSARPAPKSISSGGPPVAEVRPNLSALHEPALLSGTIMGRFVVGERLGAGAMGEVYRAEDVRLKRTVALKRLAPYLRNDPVYRRRFQQESERASRFSDAHIAAVYDVIDQETEIFLVM